VSFIIVQLDTTSPCSKVWRLAIRKGLTMADGTSTSVSVYGCLGTDKRKKAKGKWLEEVTVPTIESIHDSSSSSEAKTKPEEVKKQSIACAEFEPSEDAEETPAQTVEVDWSELGPFQHRKFLPFRDWCKAYEPLTFKEINTPLGERKPKSNSEDWVLSKLISLAAPRIENRLVAIATENASKIIYAGEQRMLEQGEIHLSLFLNGLNGFMLGYRFEKVNPKLAPKMTLFRNYAINLLYHSFHLAVVNTQQKLESDGPDGSSASLNEEERSKALIKEVMTTMEKTLYEVFDEKQREARAAIEKSSVFANSNDSSEDLKKTSEGKAASSTEKKKTGKDQSRKETKKEETSRLRNPFKSRTKKEKIEPTELPSAPIIPDFLRDIILANWDAGAEQMKEVISLCLSIIANEYEEQKDKMENEVELKLKDLSLSNDVEHDENKKQLAQELKKAYETADMRVREFARATVKLFETLVR